MQFSIEKRGSTNSVDMQLQIVNDKRNNRNKNQVRYQSMYVEFNNLKNTCEHYYQKIGERSMKRKNITLHQNRNLEEIRYQKYTHQNKNNKKTEPSAFQTILNLWKQKRKFQINVNKLTKKSGIKLRKKNQIEMIKQNSLKWRQSLIEIQKKRKNIFQQIENQMPKCPIENQTPKCPYVKK